MRWEREAFGDAPDAFETRERQYPYKDFLHAEREIIAALDRVIDAERKEEEALAAAGVGVGSASPDSEDGDVQMND